MSNQPADLSAPRSVETVFPASDTLLAELDAMAREVDALAVGDDEQQVRARVRRQRLLIELDVVGMLTGDPAVGQRLAAYPMLRGYHDACALLVAYHASAARVRLVGKPAPRKLIEGNVAIDWFRQPSGYTPANVPVLDWLALCERNFISPMPTSEGTRFVRLEGRIHVLSYRCEIGPEPKLWRAVLPE